MAVAGLVLMTTLEGFGAVRGQLAVQVGICDVEALEEDCKLVAVLEADSDKVEGIMSDMLGWEGVLTVDVAFISYEDELDAGKELRCPPAGARASREACS